MSEKDLIELMKLASREWNVRYNGKYYSLRNGKLYRLTSDIYDAYGQSYTPVTNTIMKAILEKEFLNILLKEIEKNKTTGIIFKD